MQDTHQDKLEGIIARLLLNHAALRLETRLLALHLQLRAGFRHDQPRVPAGNPEGGQWTDEGGSGNVIRVSRRLRAAGTIRVGSRHLPATPAQVLRAEQSLAAMRAAIRDVRRIDPKWRPAPQAYETVEGFIASNHAIAGQARFRLFELRNEITGPGPFAAERIISPIGRRLNKQEIAEVNRIGRRNGCHRCGNKDPGTRSGNFIGDHQTPSRLDTPTYIFPHCLACSNSQGGHVRQFIRRRETDQ